MKPYAKPAKTNSKEQQIGYLLKLTDEWMEQREHRWKDRGLFLHHEGEVLDDKESMEKWKKQGGDTVFKATDQLTGTQEEDERDKAMYGRETFQRRLDYLTVRDLDGRLVRDSGKMFPNAEKR